MSVFKNFFFKWRNFTQNEFLKINKKINAKSRIENHVNDINKNATIILSCG